MLKLNLFDNFILTLYKTKSLQKAGFYAIQPFYNTPPQGQQQVRSFFAKFVV